MAQSPSACLDTSPDAVAKVVLFPGDPLRAKALAARYLENAACFNALRGMLGFTGTYRGRRISVMGSGIGIPSATLYAHELYHFCGVESIVRIGTCGAVRGELRVRDLVFAMAASTNSGFAAQYEFPGLLAPAADFALLRAAVRAAERKALPFRVGSVFTADMFYNKSPGVNEKCRDKGILAVDMETAGLYWEAMDAGKRALSILTVSNHILRGEETPAAERETAFTDMMEVALDAAWEFAEEEMP
jgi:purine-nucleoside phosphorylase